MASQYPNSLYCMTHLFPTDLRCHTYWVHFWTLYSIPLICWCGHVLVLCSFNYYSFKICFDIWWWPPHTFFVSALFLLFHLELSWLVKKNSVSIFICISLNNFGRTNILFSLRSIFLGRKGLDRAGEENRLSFVLNISHRRNKKKHNGNFVSGQPFQKCVSKTLQMVIVETLKKGILCSKYWSALSTGLPLGDLLWAIAVKDY